jgi:soluble lytic murein transglycosylase-like protein
VFKFTDDLHLTWGDVPHKPRPSDPTPPAKPYRSAVIVVVVCFLLACGVLAAAYGIGAHRSDERAAAAATEAENANGIKVAALAEAKLWREAAEESSETAAALRSEVASLTDELELWESRYADSVKRIDALEAAAKLKLQSTPAKKPTPTQVSTKGVEQWRSLVSRYFGANTDAALRVMKGESGGNPNATNGTCHGLFQIHECHAAKFKSVTGTGDFFDATANVRFAAYMSQGGKVWTAWSVKP